MAYRVVPTKGRCGNGASGRSVRALDCRRTTLAEGRYIGSGSLGDGDHQMLRPFIECIFLQSRAASQSTRPRVADVVVGVMVGLLAYGRFVA